MKKTNLLWSLIAIMAFTFFACSTPEKPEPINISDIKVEIQAMEDAYASAEKAKNPDGVAAYYSENAISYGRNEQPISGRTAIRDNIAKRIETDTTGYYSVYKIVDLFAEGNSAIEVGSWTQFDASGTETENGHYISYFEKHDGKYECVRDMSTSSMPRK